MNTQIPDEHKRVIRSNARLGGGSGGVRRVEQNDREYLVFPVVAAQEMVLNYPEWDRKEFLPAESFQNTADMWEGRPITARHPRENTATTPDSYTASEFGKVYNPDPSDDSLTVEAWIDVAKAESIGDPATTVVDRLESGKEVATSPGYGLANERRENGSYGGESYDLVQGDVIPDHLAVFPPGEFMARCSLEDGCGAPRSNAIDTTAMETPDDDPPDPHSIRRVLGFLGVDRQRANAAGGDPENDECDCDGTCEDCASESSGNGSGDDPPDGGGERSTETTGTGDGTTPDESNTMDNTEISQLAERTAFDVEALEDWDDDALEALQATVENADADADADADAETEASGPTADADADTDAETAEARQNATENNEEVLGAIADFRDDFDERLNAVEDRLEADEHEEERRIVVNAIDGMDEDAARALPAEKLETLAEKHRDEATEARVNYSAVPGRMDRTPDEDPDDLEDYPTGGRSSYEERNAASGGD